jgi:tetratricopeptide (TPR) repeat protein
MDTLCWSIAGGATWPFHIWKILMHSVVCLCIFLIWRRLWREPGWYPLSTHESLPKFLNSERIALVLAFVFAIHPAMSEVVTYIAASTSLQCAMFYLLAFVAYLAWRDEKKGWILGASLIAYFASCMSKEEGVTLPAVVTLTAFFLEKGSLRQKITQTVRGIWPYWAVFFPLLAFMGHMVPASMAKSRGFETPLNYLMTQLRAWLWYMRLWFWPWDLNADNVEFGFSHSIADPRVIQALIGNVLLLGGAFLYRKRFPALLFGLLWFYITISPASSVIPLAEPVNEHRMYLSYVGFVGGAICILVWFFYEALSPKLTARQSIAFLSLLVIGCMIGTVNRIHVWSNSENLWTDTVEKNPSSGRAQNNLALIFMGRGEYAKAIEHLDLCERDWPNYVYCALNKGIIGLAQRNSELAEKNLQRAASLDPESPWVNFHLGRLYHEFKNDPQRAVMYFSKADALTGSRYLDAKEWIARIQLETGNKELARKLASEILKYQPDRSSVQELLVKASQ